MTPSSWLFVRGVESIRVIRPNARALSINGPGHKRAERIFEGEDAVQAYQMELAEQFSAAGWVLIGENHERRIGRERRTSLRGSDRRADAAGAARL